MKLYFGTPGWGWTMWGIGYKSQWFFGFSARREKISNAGGPHKSTK